MLGGGLLLPGLTSVRISTSHPFSLRRPLKQARQWPRPLLLIQRWAFKRLAVGGPNLKIVRPVRAGVRPDKLLLVSCLENLQVAL